MNIKLTAIAAAAAVTLLSGCVMQPTTPPQDRKAGDYAVTYLNLDDIAPQSRADALCGTTAYRTSSYEGEKTLGHSPAFIRLQNGETYRPQYWICGTDAAAAKYEPVAMMRQKDEQRAGFQQRLADMTPAQARNFLMREKHFVWATCDLWGEVVFITGDTPAISINAGVEPLHKPEYSKGAYFGQFNGGSMALMFQPAKKDHAMAITAGERVYACSDVHEDTPK